SEEKFMTRVFIALELPETVQERLVELSHGLSNVKWVAPHLIHLTLQFLGDRSDVEDIEGALESIEAPGFAITLRGVGRFVGDRNGGALWVGVDPCEALMDLHSRIGKVLRPIGIAPEKR